MEEVEEYKQHVKILCEKDNNTKDTTDIIT